MPHRLLLFVACLAAAAVAAGPALASHAWGNYHWARTANPFTVPLGDNLSDTSTSSWSALLPSVSSDWSLSSVLDAPVVAGNAGNPKRCRANDGRIEVCNTRYGFNGWLGLAQIWTSGSHIVKAVAKMNDSYFGNPSYTSTNEQHVLCQEVGHGFGLHHQSESGADLNTCMDYASALDNPSPNAHDYEQLEVIYAHLDATSTVASIADDAPARGSRRFDTIRSSYIEEDLGNGFRRHTFVYWAVPGARGA